MRNTFSPSVPNIICLPKPLRETLWRKGCRSKLPPLALSHSSPHAGSDRSGWWVDGRENDAGKKVRMTCEDMLWLPPWRDSAGLIMDGLVCWRGLNTKSLRWRRPSCLLATCIRCLLCFIAAGGYIGPGELALGFEPSFLTWEVNKQLQLMFYGCPILLSAGCQQKHPMRIMEPMLTYQPGWKEEPVWQKNAATSTHTRPSNNSLRCWEYAYLLYFGQGNEKIDTNFVFLLAS